MKILISGSSGLVGKALTSSLLDKQYNIQTLHRNTSRNTTSPHSFWHQESLADDAQTVIHLAGENIASNRWSRKKKVAILQSRIEGTRTLVDHIESLSTKPESFFCASAIGYYGNRGEEIIDETSSLGEGFLADVCHKWEAETERLTTMGIRVINLRFGMILSPNGGALHKMLPAFRKMAGGEIGCGQQYMSWISISELVEIVDFLIQNKNISGPVNVVSPTPITNQEFTKTLANVLGVPAFFKVPPFMVKILFGEMGKNLLLSSSRVIPKVLSQNGYAFKNTDLAETLLFCVKK